jgi:hypothetical protein
MKRRDQPEWDNSRQELDSAEDCALLEGGLKQNWTTASHPCFEQAFAGFPSELSPKSAGFSAESVKYSASPRRIFLGARRT